MKRVVIFGNSGSGKSTLANYLAAKYELPHLDLDTLAWQDTDPPTRKPLSDSAGKIDRFLDGKQEWVIEGCYADLLVLVLEKANEALFLNPGIETCISNCRKRPWEPHKYKSIEEQNGKLAMLLDWVKQYPIRNDEFSLVSHQKLFNEFAGKRTEYNSNDRNI